MICPVCGGCGIDPDAEFDRHCLVCWGTGTLPTSNVEMGFGPGDDEECEQFQGFLISGRIVA